MNSLLALALSFSCTGYGMIEVGFQGKIENQLPKSAIVWMMDVAYPVDLNHIEKFEYNSSNIDEPEITIHIRNPEEPEEFYEFYTKGSSGRVTFDYKGVRMNQQKVHCSY